MKTIKDLTTEQKLRLICGKGRWYTEDFDGKLPSVFMSDGPVGLRTEQTKEDGTVTTLPAVAYPSIQLLANTWSTHCASLMGQCLADDSIDRGVDILLAPGVNIKRHPLNGRNFEYFSEDPLLAGELAQSYIAAVQGQGIGVCLKHFCCNNLEYDRLHQSSDVDERTLREIYYKPFEIACRAKPVSVMCSYNRINGTYGSEYKKGFTTLREELGFDGAIISDWDAVRNRTKAAKAGLDLEMPFHQGNYEQLCADYKAGKISDEELDDCAERVLKLIERCQGMKKLRRVLHSVEERAEAAKAISAEGMVLLKNDGILPIEGAPSVMVGGCFAKPDTLDMLHGGGSACLKWIKNNFDIPAQLEKRGFKVAYEGAFRYDGVNSNEQDARLALELAAEHEIAIVCVGTGKPVEYEGGDRQSMRLPKVQEDAILEIADRCDKTIVIVFAGAAIDMSAWIDEVGAVLYAGFPGMGGDGVIADILTGKINPSGKLSETFPLSLEDVPAALAYRTAGVTCYQEGLDVGYRYFESYNIPVLFPFGHGLSYSAFDYRNLKCKVKDGKLVLSYDIENLSARAGKEISQVYVRECAPLVYRPKWELKAFDKTFVKGKSSGAVAIELTLEAFRHWSTSEDQWVAEDGVYEIAIGASVQDIRLRTKVKIKDGKIQLL